MNDLKKEKISFFMVVTSLRRFPVNQKSDIIKELSEEENAYEVRFITYVGDYEGKEDVICINTGTSTVYMTVVNDNAVAKLCTIDDQKKWIVYYNDNSLSGYYDFLREKGVLLKNDIYKRDLLYKQQVAKLLKEQLIKNLKM